MDCARPPGASASRARGPGCGGTRARRSRRRWPPGASSTSQRSTRRTSRRIPSSWSVKRKRQSEAGRHAEHGGRRVHGQELAERNPGDAGGEKRRRAKPHEVARREDDLDAVAPIRRLQRLLALPAQHVAHGAPVQHALAPVPPDPVDGRVAGQHADEATGSASHQRTSPSRARMPLARIGSSSGIGTPRPATNSTRKTPA